MKRARAVSLIWRISTPHASVRLSAPGRIGLGFFRAGLFPVRTPPGCVRAFSAPAGFGLVSFARPELFHFARQPRIAKAPFGPFTLSECRVYGGRHVVGSPWPITIGYSQPTTLNPVDLDAFGLGLAPVTGLAYPDRLDDGTQRPAFLG